MILLAQERKSSEGDAASSEASRDLNEQPIWCTSRRGEKEGGKLRMWVAITR